MSKKKQRSEIDAAGRVENTLRTIFDYQPHMQIIVFSDAEYIDLELSSYQKHFISIMANRKLPEGNDNQ